MTDFTHFNEHGRAKMVDISDKKETARKAIARSSIQMKRIVYENITEQKNKKGDVLSVAQVAGIMAAKQTSTLIPMCHPIPISGVDLSFEWTNIENDTYELMINAEVKTVGSTGVEMEALTAASVTALTVYDMCKAVDKGMIIGQTYLLEKSGGKSGNFKRKNN
ncbi:cyclic pyranopterin monophosphate synthase MoaC [Oceanobacillus caeni]|uniref:cyclic pyranopterin monophosphate synthase MoaC n=1 Tax=Oceanobacillus TaxID=182709 RepID=UPI00062138F7|nr:cyclic pyranopterin monophosphate synthase MoaC [Oceanobacillus caeni]KKE78168.1 molybdenum cofactor biosynthesis protein C [Bacilli bacterium VT-13-104]PZD84763.1 cyclic pyranopterin monophosphate synthase MoaC [Bacilli bacterium]MCR1835070.1 cyclic pyranopterin monophosphate synthase MoaC [Oceanobacillus caeni]PZD86180.1 cyclic pyranopterin monophosphate synthase MoaC [Bacilli bacterium]PZD89295.1 cyclic pyranopterin monophosphate synthase MoaC [Bacilli bacterium]